MELLSPMTFRQHNDSKLFIGISVIRALMKLKSTLFQLVIQRSERISGETNRRGHSSFEAILPYVRRARVLFLAGFTRLYPPR